MEEEIKEICKEINEANSHLEYLMTHDGPRLRHSESELIESINTEIAIIRTLLHKIKYIIKNEHEYTAKLRSGYKSTRKAKYDKNPNIQPITRMQIQATSFTISKTW